MYSSTHKVSIDSSFIDNSSSFPSNNEKIDISSSSSIDSVNSSSSDTSEYISKSSSEAIDDANTRRSRTVVGLMGDGRFVFFADMIVQLIKMD